MRRINIYSTSGLGGGNLFVGTPTEAIQFLKRFNTRGWFTIYGHLSVIEFKDGVATGRIWTTNDTYDMFNDRILNIMELEDES